MALKNYEHTERVGDFIVRDPSGMVLVCDACGIVDLTYEQAQGYEVRAARTVLLDRRDAGGPVYKYARKALGLRQADMARLLGIEAVETISRWENGHMVMPCTTQLAIVTLLDLAVNSPEEFDRRRRGEPADTGRELTVHAA